MYTFGQLVKYQSSALAPVLDAVVTQNQTTESCVQIHLKGGMVSFLVDSAKVKPMEEKNG